MRVSSKSGWALNEAGSVTSNSNSSPLAAAARARHLPARQSLERNLETDAGRLGQVAGVGGETIRDVDHRRRAVRGEPAPGDDARLGMRVATPNGPPGRVRDW